MTAQHMQASLYRGDEWSIHGTAYDRGPGNTRIRMNLTTAELDWALLNASGARVIDDDDVAFIEEDYDQGTFIIKVDSATTATVPAGRYTDIMRVTLAGRVMTIWTGQIFVLASPFVP
jgi:hypothetical protein